MAHKSYDLYSSPAKTLRRTDGPSSSSIYERHGKGSRITRGLLRNALHLFLNMSCFWTLEDATVKVWEALIS